MEKSGKMLNNHQIMWEWVYSVRTRNLSTSGTSVQEHAKLYLKNMSKTEFRASNESLQTFRKDKNLFSEVCGESNDLMRDIPKCH